MLCNRHHFGKDDTWNHQWFQRLADEELRIKRLSIDFDRANWLAELAMEWKEVEQTGIPEQILERLSRNLFMQKDGGETDIHPFETFASAIMGSAGSLKVKSPDGRAEATWDRKGLRAIEKEAEKGRE